MSLKDPLIVKDIFNSIASKYDFLNDILSFGLHRIWKRKFVRFLQPRHHEDWLDLCCGTGDLTIILAQKIGSEGSILGIDFSYRQIALAKQRMLKNSINSVSWLTADALNNGLPSNSFDGIVMAYGLRNLSSPSNGLKEIRRLLKPGGRAGILDFAHTVEGSMSSCFQKFYLRTVVVPIAWFFGLKDQYSYLEKSLKSFPEGTVQKQIAMDLGFRDVSYRLLAGGQMGVLLLKL